MTRRSFRPVLPAAPGDLVAVAVGGDQVILAWTECGSVDSDSASSGQSVTALADPSWRSASGTACRGLPRRVGQASHDLLLPGSGMERLGRFAVLQCG